MTLKALQHTFTHKLSNTQTSEELETLRVEYLGRKGIVNTLFAQINSVPAEKRKLYGQDLNNLKNHLEKLLTNKQILLSTTKHQLPTTNYQLPATHHRLPAYGHLHPITQTERELNELFHKLGFSIYDGPEIETDDYCFQRLNVPQDHPARDMQDSIYVKEPDYLLRTQTSSIEARVLASEKPPFKVAFPGRTYRNEKVNKSNHFIFHQYQAVVVDHNVTMQDLFGTIDLLFKSLYGSKVVVRYRPKYYPEVEPGVGPDMQCFSCHGTGCPLCKGAGWLEMGGAGIIHPKVLRMAGIDPTKWRGFAFGLGLDRWVMAKYHITDIRTLLGGNLAYKPHHQ